MFFYGPQCIFTKLHQFLTSSFLQFLCR